MNPLYHYNDSEPLDPYIYRCYKTSFFINSSKAAVFAGLYTSRTDEELFQAAEVEPFFEPTRGDLEQYKVYKRNIEKMMKNLIKNGKLTFLKDFEMMDFEPSTTEKDSYYNYLAMHSSVYESEILLKTKTIRDEKKKEKEEKAKKKVQGA